MKYKMTLLLLASLVLTSSVCFAKDTELSLQISKLKNAKNAKVKVIDAQTDVLKTSLTNILMDEKLTQEQKDTKMLEIQNKLEELNNQKSQINYQYKLDKQKLKGN